MATLGYGTGGSGHRVGGYPQYDGWPRWNSYTHQSMYEDWLDKQAVWRLDSTRPHIQKVERTIEGRWRGWLALPVKKR